MKIRHAALAAGLLFACSLAFSQQPPSTGFLYSGPGLAGVIPIGGTVNGQCLLWGNPPTFGSCSGGSGTAFQVNGTGLLASATVNFLNSALTGGLTLTFTNTSAGNVQLGLSGWPALVSGDCLSNNGSALVWSACGGGAGTVTDGAGTTTANELLLSSTTVHAYTNAVTLPASAMPALTGDVTSSAGTTATTVSKVNGASVPASATVLGTNSSSQPIAATTTGSGTTVVLATSPALVTPNLGTPSAVTLTNATGLPVAGLTGLGTGMSGFLALAWPSLVNADCLTNNGTALSWGSCGSGSGITLQTNGTNNPNQTTLNVQSGTQTTASNPSSGNVTVDLASQATNTVCSNVSGSSGIPSCGTTLASFQGALVAANAQTVSPTPATGPVNDWDPTLLSPPVQSNPSTSTTGGTLAASTYFYEITALNARGETTVSNEKSITTTGTTSSNTITWAAVVGATSYRVYRGTATGAENVYYAPGNVTTYTDTGATSTAGSPPGTNGTGGAILTTAFAYTTPASGGTTIDGMVAGSNGEQTFITNTETAGVGTDNIVLKNQSSSDSTAANRFSSPGDVTVAPGGTAGCVYLSVNVRWNCVLVSTGGSSAFSSLTSGENNSATMTVGPSAIFGILGSSGTGYTNLASANASSTNYTATLPANTGTILENNAIGTITVRPTFGAGWLSTGIAVASFSPLNATGTMFTGGTGTTTWPYSYINLGATAPTTFSTNGSIYGLNLPSGFTGRIADWYINGTEVGKISTYGNLTSLPNTATSATSVTPNCEYAFVKVTASATGTFTINAPNTCTPVDGQKLEIKIISPSGGILTYSWNAAFLAGSGTPGALPTTSTAASKEDYFSFQYDADKSGWVYLAEASGF